MVVGCKNAQKSDFRLELAELELGQTRELQEVASEGANAAHLVFSLCVLNCRSAFWQKQATKFINNTKNAAITK